MPSRSTRPNIDSPLCLYINCYCYLPLNGVLRPGICWRPSSGPRTSTVRRVGRGERTDRDPDPSTLVEGPHLLRADFGFCREHLMARCETNRVD